MNHVPRIEDLRLAEALGIDRPRNIRQLIERHRAALERFGEVCCTAQQTSDKGGRPGKTYWLNKRQALFVCTKSETPNATETTIEMVEVFDAWQTGALAVMAPPEPLPGFMMMKIAGRQITIDSRDFAIGAGDEAVVIGYGGEIQILRGPLESAARTTNLGKRSVAEHWRKPKVPRPSGVVRERGYVTVLGRLIQPGEKRRRMLAA